MDEGKPLSPAIKKHLLGCPKCRAFFKTALRVEEVLLDSSHRMAHRITDEAIDRMVSAAMDSTAARISSRQVWKRYAATAVAACLIVAASLMIPLIRQSDSFDDSGFVRNNPVASLQLILTDLRPAITTLPIPSSPTALPAYLASPYQRELNLLSRDTDSAVKFVASCAGINLSDRRLIPEMNF